MTLLTVPNFDAPGFPVHVSSDKTGSNTNAMISPMIHELDARHNGV
jgi:hypothetical protein